MNLGDTMPCQDHGGAERRRHSAQARGGREAAAAGPQLSPKDRQHFHSRAPAAPPPPPPRWSYGLRPHSCARRDSAGLASRPSPAPAARPASPCSAAGGWAASARTPSPEAATCWAPLRAPRPPQRLRGGARARDRSTRALPDRRVRQAGKPGGANCCFQTAAGLPSRRLSVISAGAPRSAPPAASMRGPPAPCGAAPATAPPRRPCRTPPRQAVARAPQDPVPWASKNPAPKAS